MGPTKRSKQKHRTPNIEHRTLNQRIYGWGGNGAGVSRARWTKPRRGLLAGTRANQSNRRVELPANIQHTRCRGEAGAGIEPANSGFADRDLTTWLPRRGVR